MTRIAVCLATWRTWRWEEVARQINAQTVKPTAVYILPTKINDAAQDLARNTDCSTRLFERQEGNWADAFQQAACDALGEGWLVSWSDDDFYGANHLAEVVKTIEQHPDAWMIGKYHCKTKWIGGTRDGQTEEWRDVNFAGTTVCFPTRLRNKYPEFRVPQVNGIYDGFFLMDIARKIWQRENPGKPEPFYHHEGDFILQRFADPKHKHEWNDARDHQ
jgi:GT2 family glycosyltransferase